MYEYLLNSFQSCCSGLSLDDKLKPAIKHHRGSSEPHNNHHSWHHSLSLMAHPNLPIVTFYSACVYCSPGIKKFPQHNMANLFSRNRAFAQVEVSPCFLK